MTENQQGMFGAHGTGDTSGYGGLVRSQANAGSAQRPFGGYFDQVADAYQLERPPRLTAAAVKEKVSPMLWSFMRESRRVSNTRLKELKIALRYPNVASFISKCPLVPPSD